MKLYEELQLPPRPPMSWPPSNAYSEALERAAVEFKAAEPWLLVALIDGPRLVAKRRTWWMRVVTWWLNLHVRQYAAALSQLKADAIERARLMPDRNGGV